MGNWVLGFLSAENKRVIKLSEVNFIIKDGDPRRFKLAEIIVPFYPTILVVIAMPLLIHFGQQWMGFILGGILLSLISTWYTCIFGLCNVISIIGLFIVCAAPYLK